MRDIIFRARHKHTGEWVEGWFIAKSRTSAHTRPLNIPRIIDKDLFSYEVDEKTVCEYTGLKDKNGKRIFEGDIIRIFGNQNDDDWKNVDYNALIIFKDGGFCAIDGTPDDYAFRRYGLARNEFDIEVIGNYYDNPELLEV